MKFESRREPTGESDESLMGRFADTQDQDAFEELHFRYRGKLKGYIRRHYLPRQDEAVEDVIQQTFLKVSQNAGQFDRTKTLRPWLYTLACNTAINYIEYKSARPMHQLSTEYQESENQPGSKVLGNTSNNEPVDPHDEVMAELEANQEKLGLLWAAADDLPPQQRRAVELVYRDGLSYKEAADELGVTTSTLGVWIHRGLRVMRNVVLPEVLADAA